MPATLAPNTAVFAPIRSRRSFYEQVAVCPDYVWTSQPVNTSSKGMRLLMRASPPACTETPSEPKADELDVQWVIDKVLKEIESTREQLKDKGAYFEGIHEEFITQTTQSLAFWLWAATSPMQLTTTLTYNQSLHVRAVLPLGVVHFSVQFSPGIDPAATADLGEDEADNTVLSLYDTQGKHIGGAVGPFQGMLTKLIELLPAA